MLRCLLGVGVSVAALAAASTAAQSADLPVKAPSAVVQYNWSGVYAGVNVGAGFAGTRATVSPVSALSLPDQDDLTKSGFTGGAQVGANWQFAPNWVVGAEADFNSLSLSRTICIVQNCNVATQFDVTAKSSWIATARGRVGYAFDRSLVYATGGAAWVRSTDQWSYFSLTAHNSKTETRSGFAVGGGIETALFGNWTAKAEYIFVDTGTGRVQDPAPTDFVDFKHQYHLARFGLNYRLGETPASQAYASARYAAAPVASWTGLYLGGNAGVVASATRFDVPTSGSFVTVGDNVDIYGKGFTGGVQAGYNWQVAANWVVGVEGDFGALSMSRSYTSINTLNGTNDTLLSAKSDWAATVRGRVGYAWDRSLLYATGGAAVVHVKDAWTDGAGAFAETDDAKWGWTAGGGIEAALTANWSVKTEYLYIDAGKVDVADAATPGGSGATFSHRYHVARAGLNYRFATR